ncbi:MAG TPA: type VI secretion system protein TssA [Herbaspirillum sp.]
MSAVSEQLNPIDEIHPCGDDLSFSADLDAIAEARRFDDPTLDQGEWVTEIKEADWRFVEQRCALLLATKSKDLRLAVWYTEAAARTRGLRGLGDGYLLIAGLCERFWSGMHPVPEDGDMDRKIGNLGWLLSQSIQLIRSVPLTEGRGTAFSLADFEAATARAAHAARIAAEGGQPEEGVKLNVMEAARRKSSRPFFEALLADAGYCMDALLQMEKSVDARLGVDGPGFSSVKETLRNAMETIARYAADTGVRPRQNIAEANAGTDAASAPASAGQGMALPAPHDGAIRNREQAIAQLRAVADFFRRTEPHSPVAYIAEKAANWGELPLHAWLKSVIKDNASLSHVEELLGLQAPPLEE